MFHCNLSSKQEIIFITIFSTFGEKLYYSENIQELSLWTQYTARHKLWMCLERQRSQRGKQYMDQQLVNENTVLAVM